MGGQLAHAFGKLVEELWTCRTDRVSPSGFKVCTRLYEAHSASPMHTMP
jgi:hypothetical protein